MAAAYNESVYHPLETEINQCFDRIITAVNGRRLAVLSAFRELHKEIAAKPETRAKMIEELTSIKTETESRLQANDLHELQEKLLAKIKAELENARTPIPETKIVFRSELQTLDELIAKVGEVLEVSLSSTNEVSSTEPPQGVPAPPDPTRAGDGPPSNASNLNT